MKTVDKTLFFRLFYLIPINWIRIVNIGIIPTFKPFLTTLKSEFFRLLSRDFSLFFCYYYLIFKAFKYIKQQQFVFNCQYRNFSDFSPIRIQPIIILGPDPAPRFTPRIKKPPANSSVLCFLRGVRGSWMPRVTFAVRCHGIPAINQDEKSCNKTRYRKLTTPRCARNLSITRSYSKLLGLLRKPTTLNQKWKRGVVMSELQECPYCKKNRGVHHKGFCSEHCRDIADIETRLKKAIAELMNGNVHNRAVKILRKHFPELSC